MSRKDRIHTEINWLKMWVTLAVTAFFAITGWIFIHYETATDFQILLATLALILITVSIVSMNASAKRYMQELEELE